MNTLHIHYRDDNNGFNVSIDLTMLYSHRRASTKNHPLVFIYQSGKRGIGKKRGKLERKKEKHTTGGIPRWSPTLVLVARFSAYVWQSGRDAQFSLTYGRMCLSLQPISFCTQMCHEIDRVRSRLRNVRPLLPSSWDHQTKHLVMCVNIVPIGSPR